MQDLGSICFLVAVFTCAMHAVQINIPARMHGMHTAPWPGVQLPGQIMPTRAHSVNGASHAKARILDLALSHTTARNCGLLRDSSATSGPTALWLTLQL